MSKAETAQQIPFDLEYRPAFNRDDFLVTECNREAVDWIDRWPKWPAPVLVLHGPSASGKSHLGAVWAKRAKAIQLTPNDLLENLEKTVLEKGPKFLDRADLLIGDREAETALFHLFNATRENNETLLMTSCAPAASLEFTLPDLSSRLRSMPMAAIHAPDDTLLSALVVKLFSDRQVTITKESLRYLLPRMERSFAAARDLVEKADRLALSEKKPVSLSILRRVLMG